MYNSVAPVRGTTTHTGMATLTSIINQENALQVFRNANLKEAIPQLGFFLTGCSSVGNVDTINTIPILFIPSILTGI